MSLTRLLAVAALALTLILGFNPRAHAAVTFDAKATSVTATSTGTGPVLNTTLTAAAAATAIEVSMAFGANPGAVSCTWNGVAMNVIGSVSAANNVTAVILGLAGAAGTLSGGAHTASCSWTNGAVSALNVSSWAGTATTTAAAFGNFVSAIGPAASTSIAAMTVTNASGSIALDVGAAFSPCLTTPSQTQIGNNCVQVGFADSYSIGVNPSFSWGYSSGSDYYAHAGVSIKPAAGSGVALRSMMGVGQ